MPVKGRVRPSKAISAMVLFASIAFVLLGVGYVIPNFGAFGVLWTIFALAIGAYHAFNLLSDRGVAEQVVEFDASNEARPDAPPAASAEERLRGLDDLRQKGLLSEDEYQQQRKKIVGEL